MEIRSHAAAEPFATADGSTIRSLLDLSNSPVANQSLAEATLPPAGSTARHHHRLTEELYYVLSGTGEMEIGGERRRIGPGDAILIPPGAGHQITADDDATLRFLCCCAPPYSHEDTYLD